MVPASSQLRELGNSGNEPLDSLRGEDSLQSDDTAMSTTSRPAESALDTVKPTKSARRAARLRAQYPDMEEIPDCVSRPQEVKLVAKHVANGGRPAQMKPAAPKNLPKAQLPKAHLPKGQLPKGQLPKGQLSKGQLSKGQPSKGESRAHGLKRSFPDMVNVPKSISKKQRQSMVESYKAVKKAAPQDTTQMQNGQLTQLPERPVPTPQQPFPRRDIEKRPVSNKMAPLSNARRAEVARNLSGNSNDDPIALD